MKTTIKFKLRPSKGSWEGGTITVYVTRHRITRTVSSGILLKYSEWDSSLQSVVIDFEHDRDRAKELLQAQRELSRIHSNLRREIRRLSNNGDYTVNDLLTAYRGNRDTNTLGRYVQKKIDERIAAGQFGSARCYQSAFDSFMGFRNGCDIPLRCITKMLIAGYEEYLHVRGNSKNTISCYMRSLRAIYNYAVKEGLLPIAKYHPFCEAYTGNAKTEKRCVSKEEIASVAQLQLPPSKTESLSLSRDLFLFSFYTQGMPFIDMINLTRTNLQGEDLVYKRQKTGQEIRIKLLPCMEEIIRKYSDRKDSRYLFPVLSSQSDKAVKRREYLNGLTRYNRGLKRLSILSGLGAKLTGYVARHTWATCAAGEGIALSTISRSMGHDSEKTTRIYIGTLDNSDVNSANKKVLSFLTDQSDRKVPT